MGKFDGVLLVSDYDDTFYHSGGYISRGNRDAVDYFQAEGGRFTLATGRVHSTLARQVEEHGLRFAAPVILSNGAQIYDYTAGSFLREVTLRREIVRDLHELDAHFPGLAFEAYHGDEVYISNPDAFIRRHMARVGMTFPELAPDDMPQPWFKALFTADNERLRKVQQFIHARWDDAYEAVFSNRILLELTAKGCHKGGAVLWLAQHLGIARQHVYCIGDNQNDVPMLAVAATPFAPANCVPEVRATGARIVRSCDDDAVAEVIEILDGLYPCASAAK